VERAQQNVALSLAKSQRGGRARVEQAETVERIIGGGVAESRRAAEAVDRLAEESQAVMSRLYLSGVEQ
ncbi:unnamed protein product, partial [Durusdinium trenchii]